MVRVSDKKLQKDVLKRLHNRFADGLAEIHTRRAASEFLDELLGEEEQLMLAKRLASIYMLSEDISSYRVSKTLGLSISTVLKVRNRIDKNGYTFILAQYRNKKCHRDIWKDLELLLRLGMPSREGSRRWEYLNKINERNK